MDLRLNSPPESQSDNDPVSSTPIPQRRTPNDSPDQEASTSEVNVALVRPGNCLLSERNRVDDGDRETRASVTQSGGGFRAGSNQSGSINGESGQNSRPNSAPARTPSRGRSGSGIMPFISPPKFPRSPFPSTAASLRSHFLTSQDISPSSPAVQSSAEREGSPEMESMSWPEEPAETFYVANDNDRSYRCSSCSFSTPYVANFREHIKTHGTDPKVMFKCSLCNFIAPRKSTIRSHRRSHHKRPNNPAPTTLQCEKCQFCTTTPQKLREHYSRLHNMEYGTSYIQTSIFNMRTATINSSTPNSNRSATFSADRGMCLDVNGHSRALHAFRLAQPRGTLQFDADPSSSSTASNILPAGLNPAFSPSLPGLSSLHRDSNQNMMDSGEDTHTVSNHFVTDMTIGLNPSRVPITSTVTSIEYPARPANPHRPDLNCYSPLRGPLSSNFRDFFSGPFTSSPSRGLRSSSIHNSISLTPHGQGDGAVKVKLEPVDRDGDVTSSGLISFCERGGGIGLGIPRRDILNSSSSQSQIRFRPYESVVCRSGDQSDEVGPGDASRVSQSSDASSTGGRAVSLVYEETDRELDLEEERRKSHYHHLLALVKTETSNVGVQCSGCSSFKPELPARTVTVAAADYSTEGVNGDNRQATEERGIQCELIASPPRSSRLSSTRLSTDSEQHSMSGCESRCSHCGITFEDEVLFTIHIGCHSHTDPFVCNVCGKKCGNKYGFYSHITRGHHM